MVIHKDVIFSNDVGSMTILGVMLSGIKDLKEKWKKEGIFE